MAQKSTLGVKVKAYVERGLSVPNDIIVNMVQRRITQKGLCFVCNVCRVVSVRIAFWVLCCVVLCCVVLLSVVLCWVCERVCVVLCSVLCHWRCRILTDMASLFVFLYYVCLLLFVFCLFCFSVSCVVCIVCVVSGQIVAARAGYWMVSREL